MSTTKRSRTRQSGAATVATPSSKRRKTTETAHVPEKTGLGFLVDEDARSGRKLDAKLTNGLQASNTARADESRAAISRTNGVLESEAEASDASGQDEESVAESSDVEEDDNDEENGVISKSAVNGHPRDIGAESEAEDVQMEDAAAAEAEQDATPEEPSFADLLQSRYPGTIDVQAAAPASSGLQLGIVGSGTRTLAPPSGTSLTTVLTQALKTDDRDLLESCLHMTDIPSIRSTIQRLPSQHVGKLLERLAERIHKRPGRVGPLMVWVQWSLVAHGAFLASQPDILKKVRSLHYVVKERASGLQPLLHLRGKLDMLSAQLELRRDMQAASRAANANEEDEDDAVIYVDGQDEDWFDSDEEAEKPAMIEAPKSRRDRPQQSTPKEIETLPNGIPNDSESEESEDDEEMDGVIDDEAEEASDDEGSSAVEDSSAPESEDEGDESSSDEESEASVKQPELKKLNRKR